MTEKSSLLSEIVNLKSLEGNKLLVESELKNVAMVDMHKHQEIKTFCGPASLALVANSINAGYRLKYQLLSSDRDGSAEEKIQKLLEQGPVLVNENEVLQCIDENIVKQTKIDTDGLTLGELSTFAMHLGFGVTCYYVLHKDERNKLTENKQQELSELLQDADCFLIDNIDEFRSRIIRNVAHEGRDRQIKGIIMNFDMGELDPNARKIGHFSPVAAFHKRKDMVLIADVWPGKELRWVPLQVLWNAVAFSLDPGSNLPRGFLHIYELM